AAASCSLVAPLPAGRLRALSSALTSAWVGRVDLAVRGESSILPAPAGCSEVGMANFRRHAWGFEVMVAAAFAVLVLSFREPAAQPAPPSARPEMREACPGLIAARRPRARPASLAGDQVRITYIGHSTFLIESPGLVRIATDYNNY